jgi:hypothetical protein
LTSYWLNTNCAGLDDCDGADFPPEDGDVDFADYSTFAEQWLVCNEPAGEGCIENW